LPGIRREPDSGFGLKHELTGKKPPSGGFFVPRVGERPGLPHRESGFDATRGDESGVICTLNRAHLGISLCVTPNVVAPVAATQRFRPLCESEKTDPTRENTDPEKKVILQIIDLKR
jgi:hypothetical protein